MNSKIVKNNINNNHSAQPSDWRGYITIRGFYLFDYEKKKIYFYNNIGSVPNKLIEEK